MKNAENLVATFTFTAIGLFVLSLASYLSGAAFGSAAQPFITAIIGILIILDLILIYLIATQADATPHTFFSVLLFVGLSALIVLVWFTPFDITSAGLALGYALVFLFADAVVMTQAVSSPNYVIDSRGRPSARWGTIVTMLRGERQQAAYENRAMQYSIERKVDEVKYGERETKQEIKEELKDVKHEVQQEIKDVKQEVKDVKREVTEEVKKALTEKTFFVASKTGKSLHRKNCIVLGNIPKKNRITFEDEKFAVKQGYKLCRVCFPTGKA